MEKPQSGLPNCCLTHLTRQSKQMCFFYLFKIIIIIIRINTMIVSAYKLNKSKLIILSNKLSIICTTSFVKHVVCGGKLHLYNFSFPMDGRLS